MFYAESQLKYFLELSGYTKYTEGPMGKLQDWFLLKDEIASGNES